MFSKWMTVAILSLSMLFHSAVSASEEAARQLVQETADKVIEAIAQNQAAIESDPDELLKIVDEILLPRIDFERMSRLTLGRHWNRATEQERRDFIAEFRQLLVRTYAGPLSSLDDDQEVVVVGVRAGSDDNDLLVRSEVRGGSESIPVDYRVYQVNGDWKAYDVVIDGISLIANYRGSFSQQVQRQGMQGLIDTLRERNN